MVNDYWLMVNGLWLMVNGFMVYGEWLTVDG
jgi:hypothetical protein